MSDHRLQQIANAHLTGYLRYSSGDRRADEATGRKHGAAGEPKVNDRECLYYGSLLGQAKGALGAYERDRMELVITNERQVDELAREADENYQKRKAGVLEERTSALAELNKTVGPRSTRMQSAVDQHVEARGRASQIEADLGRPLRTSMVPIYPFILLIIAIAEIPINRLAFELFFQEAPIVSLFLSFAVGLLLAFFAHQAGLWLRQAASYKTLGGKLGHLAGVLLIIAIAAPLLYFIAAMRQHYLALLEAEAASDFGTLLRQGLEGGLSSAREVLSVELGGPGWTLLILNMALLVVGAIVSFVRHDPHPDYEAAVTQSKRTERRLNKMRWNYERREAALSRQFDERISTLDRQLVRIDNELATARRTLDQAAQHQPAMVRAVARTLVERFGSYRIGNRLGRTDGASPPCLDDFSEPGIARALQRSLDDAPMAGIDDPANVVDMRSAG
ncbi:MAG TPA: hypothetical protein VHL31_08410 [Geminicoccus sp.]|jgi:hypothetical protein|uniref:hypothetical protein n=1 Tax=Geminicoccus sp. TaxID=2024832 RepID=UPI002E37D1E5|nr:hypothetical protein [Geminicoccus sp.]HEX2526312.1 hypothetical protein [Geminicoccus sp.]